MYRNKLGLKSIELAKFRSHQQNQYYGMVYEKQMVDMDPNRGVSRL